MTSISTERINPQVSLFMTIFIDYVSYDILFITKSNIIVPAFDIESNTVYYIYLFAVETDLLPAHIQISQFAALIQHRIH